MTAAAVIGELRAPRTSWPSTWPSGWLATPASRLSTSRKPQRPGRTRSRRSTRQSSSCVSCAVSSRAAPTGPAVGTPSPSFRGKLILCVFLLVRLCAVAGRVYYPCHRLGA